MITKDDIKVGAKFIKLTDGTLVTVTKIRNDDQIAVEVGFNKDIKYYSNPSVLAERLNESNYKLMNPESKPEIIEIEHKGRKIKFNLTAAEKAGIMEVEPKIVFYDGVKYQNPITGKFYYFSLWDGIYYRVNEKRIVVGVFHKKEHMIELIKKENYVLVEE